TLRARTRRGCRCGRSASAPRDVHGSPSWASPSVARARAGSISPPGRVTSKCCRTRSRTRPGTASWRARGHGCTSPPTRCRDLAIKVSRSGDHGIILAHGESSCTVEHNESFSNARPDERAANGIYLEEATGNTLRWNLLHDNQDTGMQMDPGASGNLSLQNCSWNNGDHGYDHLSATGNFHVGDVAFANFKDGFSFEGGASGNSVENCIAIENGLTTNEFDLWVDASSTDGFQSNDNIFWNSTAQPPVKYTSVLYASVAAYASATGQDGRTAQANPGFVDGPAGDFHLMAGSPAIDSGNSGVTGWSSVDDDGLAPVDDPSTSNTGLGPVAFADRGALEFQVATTGVPMPQAPSDAAMTSSVSPNPLRGTGA